MAAATSRAKASGSVAARLRQPGRQLMASNSTVAALSLAARRRDRVDLPAPDAPRIATRRGSMGSGSRLARLAHAWKMWTFTAKGMIDDISAKLREVEAMILDQ